MISDRGSIRKPIRIDSSAPSLAFSLYHQRVIISSCGWPLFLLAYNWTGAAFNPIPTTNPPAKPTQPSTQPTELKQPILAVARGALCSSLSGTRSRSSAISRLQMKPTAWADPRPVNQTAEAGRTWMPNYQVEPSGLTIY